jgi:poly(3-hydroxybutyrate) depolymerase
LTTKVAPGHPGAGRRVYPSLFQLLAYGMASPGLYAEVQHGLLREIAAGKVGLYDRQHVDLHSLQDVPAELFIEMLDWVLDGPSSNGQGWSLGGGAAHDLAGLARLPVLSVEAGSDELVGRGQSHAVDGHLPAMRAVTVPGARHHDLFTGPGFFAGVAPVLRRYYSELAP